MSSAAAPMAETRAPDPGVVFAPVPPAKVDELWPRLAPFLDRIPEMGSRYTVADVLDYTRKGALQAWGVVEGEQLLAVFFTEVCDWPRRRVLRIPYIAGEHMERWIGHLPQFEAFIRGEGFDEIELQGRPGWERVTGYRERFRTFVKDLREDGDG